MKKQYTIEKSTGNIKLNNFNLFLKDVEDMELIEEWEDRLDKLEEPYVLAFRKVLNKVKYSFFVDSGNVKSAFYRKRIKPNGSD